MATACGILKVEMVEGRADGRFPGVVVTTLYDEAFVRGLSERCYSRLCQLHGGRILSTREWDKTLTFGPQGEPIKISEE